MNTKEVKKLTDPFCLRIAICDDDPLMLERLTRMVRDTLSDHYDMQICTAGCAEELLATEQVFHVVVLDIQLPESSGIELARVLMKKAPHCRVIFVSGFACYVSDVYDVPHLCMVLKDQLEQQFPRFLLRAAAAAAAQAGQRLMLREKGAPTDIPLEDICYMERQGHWTYICLHDGTRCRTKEKLEELRRRMGSPMFCRCHISYMVNLRHVKAMANGQLTLENDLKIPVSRPNRQAVREAFFQYLSDNT